MAKLIQIRQRIKAIETIKKVTHAMRLISMSSHSRLRGKQEPLRNYRAGINALFAKLQPFAPDWTNPIMYPATHGTTLYILVGSQKGLCGTFNTNLFAKFTHILEQNAHTPFYLITVGKKATDFVSEHYAQRSVRSFDDFSPRTLASIASDIIDVILSAPQPFSQVVVVSNEFTGFFVQKPREAVIIPFNQARPAPALLRSSSFEGRLGQESIPAPIEDLLWYQQPKEILDMLAQQYIEAELQALLFESLLAEHAARFISMDAATRNAETLLEETKADYNKLRQAKITKELTELTSSFSSNS